MKATHSQLRVVCAWCNEVMIEGRGPEKDQISHSCCCRCKARYFPTMADASDCRMELIDQEHDRAYQGGSPKSDICHVDTLECKVCKRIEKTEPYPCDCGEGD